MSFKYNTRNSSHYNTPGTFVPADNYQAPPPPAPPQPTVPSSRNNSLLPEQLQDIDMSNANRSGDNSNPTYPHWMKSRLGDGVRKISTRERRRRQNKNLRRLLTPKNALMIFNELIQTSDTNSQFTVYPVESGARYQDSTQNFCAEVNFNGKSFKGFGENKIAARNAAAEIAIRDLVIQKMDATSGEDAESDPTTEDEKEEDTLPMIQLASFALHKLFSEWESKGHKVPFLKPSSTSGNVSDSGSVKASKSKAPRELPPNAAQMHPCMLLTYMRYPLEYKELGVEGGKPPSLVFTMGLNVEGTTYTGRGMTKKEARKQAAKAACVDLFNVQFDEDTQH